MSFFNSQHQTLPKRGRNKLPLLGKRARRLKLLQQFDVGRLYTFEDYYITDLPDALPFGVLIEEIGDDYCKRH